jgi:hypothetical protein
MKKIKKSVLIPMAKFEQLQNSTSMNSNNLEHVSKSIQLESNIKKASEFHNEMSSIVNNPDLTDHSKLQLYLRAIKNFLLFKDKGLTIKNQPQLVRIVNGNDNTSSTNGNQKREIVVEKFLNQKESSPNSSLLSEDTVVDQSFIEHPTLDTSDEFVGDVSPTRSIIKQSEIGIKNVEETSEKPFQSESDILSGLKGTWKSRGKELLSDLLENPNIRWNKQTGQIAIRNIPFVEGANIKDLVHFEVLKRTREYKNRPTPSGYQEFKTFLKNYQISPAKSSRGLRVAPTKKTLGVTKSVKRRLALPPTSSTPKRAFLGTVFNQTADTASTSIDPIFYEAY